MGEFVGSLSFGSGLVAGVVLALVAVFGFWLRFPSQTEVFLGQLLRLLAWAGRFIRKRAVRADIEGRLGLGRQALNQDASGLLPYGAKVRWTNSETAESYLKDGEVIVRLSYRDHPHRNLVMAALMYFRRGVIPESTQYLRKSVQKAISLLMVDQMLSHARMADSLNYYRDDILRPECESDGVLSTEFETMTKLQETGYFLRVFIPEMMDYPLKTLGSPPRSDHVKETTAFVGYLRALADMVYLESYLEWQAGTAGLAPLDFFEQRIRASLIIVGRSVLLNLYGYEAYLKRIAWCRRQGCRTIYLTGSSQAADAVPGIAKTAQRRGLARVVDQRRVLVPTPLGRIPRAYARLLVEQPSVREKDQQTESGGR